MVLEGDRVPEGALVFVPPSEPLADAAELGAPPALAELNEYIDDTDMRFVSISDMEGLLRRAASGNCECLDSSDMIPGDNLGVSISSTAMLSLLDRRLFTSAANGNRHESAALDFVEYDEEVLDREREGGGIEMLARSACVVVVPGSAYLPLRLEAALKGPTGSRTAEGARVFLLGRRVELEVFAGFGMERELLAAAELDVDSDATEDEAKFRFSGSVPGGREMSRLPGSRICIIPPPW